MEDRIKLKRLWKQSSVPVVYRPPGKEGVMVRLPYAKGNRKWLKGGRARRVSWEWRYKCWLIARSGFNRCVDICLERYGKVYVIQPYRKSEKCAPACWNAVGHECQCSCMGANHGMGQQDGWYTVSETFAVKHVTQHLSCKLLETI